MNDSILNKLKENLKYVYFGTCALYVVWLLCAFIGGIIDLAGGSGVGGVLSEFFGTLFFAPLLALGVCGIVLKKDRFCKAAFAILLGGKLYELLVGTWETVARFDVFKYYQTSAKLYYVFSFLTGLIGLAFAFAVVSFWLFEGRDVIRVVSGFAGVAYVAMNALMVIFTIVLTVDAGVWVWIFRSLFDVALAAFLVILSHVGSASMEKIVAPAEEVAKEPEAETFAADAPAEEVAETPAE